MKHILTSFFVLVSISAFAQTGLLKGKIVHADSQLPFAEVSVTIKNLKVISSTNGEGEYQFSNVPYGSYDLSISADGINEEQLNVSVNSKTTLVATYELKSIETTGQNQVADNSLLNAEDANSEDDNTLSSSGQNISSVLNASRDPFLQAATFGWGQYFFRIRGYENDNNLLYLNGVPMNDLEEGGVFYNSWSGLNDVFRGKTVSLGLAPAEYNFGGLGLNTSLDASASNIRKGTKFTYTATNRSYRNRIMLTHSSGLQKNGWAYSVSFSKRWAQEGYVKGTFYDAYGYYGAIEKHFKHQNFSLMVVGAPIKRGKAGPSTDEARDLAGTNYYNPNWGYQNGKIRNAKVLTSHSPLFVFTHEAALSSKTKLTSAISYQFGETAQTGIDWQNAWDPRPDYYRYMPSYQDSAKDANDVANKLRANPDLLQVQWDSMYQSNKNNQLSGYKDAVFIQNATVETTKKLNISVNMQHELSNHIIVHTGLNMQTQNNHNFQRVEDLMGGSYFRNINLFTARTFGSTISAADQLNTLETDDKKVVGDHYGYDYNIHFSKAEWFAQSVFSYNKVDFFLAGELGYTNFYRTGHYQSPLYVTNSYGNSSTNTFFTYKAKGGVTYKLNGRNYLYANGAIGTRAPYVDNVIVSPRTRNEIISNPMNEKFQSAEVGYLLRSPNVKARLTLYATDVKNASDIKRYYSDDDYSFNSMVLQGINKRYTGIEFGTEIKLSPALTVSLAGNLSQAFYTSRPYIDIYTDNEIGTSNTTINGERDTVYMKNYYVPAGPQTALQAALNYRSKNYWYGSLAANYMANNWMDFAPTGRTKNGVDDLVYGSEAWHHTIDQKKLPNAFTVDFNCGKSFKVNKYIKKAGNQMFLAFNLGISNILNNKKIIQYGFENNRINNQEPNLFVPKYGYALGTTYFLNISLKF